MTSTTSRPRQVGIAIVIGIATVIGFKLLELPKWPLVDQANFQLVAREWRHGRGLYTDLWDVKPPGIFWTYATVQSLFGDGQTPVVLVDALLVALAIGLVFQALHRCPQIDDGTLLAGIGFTASLHVFWFFAGSLSILQTETVTVAVTAAVFALGSRDRLSVPAVILAGACATFLKGIPVLVILGLAMVFWGPDRRRRRLGLSLGGIGVLVLIGLATLVSRDAVGPFREALRYGGFYRSLALTPASTLAPLLGILTLPTLLAGVGLHGPDRPRPVRGLALWLGLATLSILLQGKFWGYHFVAILLPLGALAGRGLERLRSGLDPRIARWVVLLVVLIQGGLALDSQLTANVPTVEYLTGRLPSDRFLELQVVSWDLMTADEVVPILETLKTETGPRDEVLVFGIVPQVPLLASRPFYGPYVFHYFLLADGPMSTPFGDLSERQRRFLDRFDRTPPRAVLVPDDQSPQPGIFETSRELATFPDLVTRLEQDYETRRIGSFRLFLRHEPAASTPPTTGPPEEVR